MTGKMADYSVFSNEDLASEFLRISDVSEDEWPEMVPGLLSRGRDFLLEELTFLKGVFDTTAAQIEESQDKWEGEENQRQNIMTGSRATVRRWLAGELDKRLESGADAFYPFHSVVDQDSYDNGLFDIFLTLDDASQDVWSDVIVDMAASALKNQKRGRAKLPLISLVGHLGVIGNLAAKQGVEIPLLSRHVDGDLVLSDNLFVDLVERAFLDNSDVWLKLHRLVDDTLEAMLRRESVAAERFRQIGRAMGGRFGKTAVTHFARRMPLKAWTRAMVGYYLGRRALLPIASRSPGIVTSSGEIPKDIRASLAKIAGLENSGHSVGYGAANV